MTVPRLRAAILADRDRQASTLHREKSTKIGNTLLSLLQVIHSRHVFIYVSFRSEVATHTIIDALLAMGKEVSVPVISSKGKCLESIRITDPETQLAPGHWGIPEPLETVCAVNRVDLERLDCIVLPGAVFDERGGRFGYGGGYYDRLLARVPGAPRIGLAFELQVTSRIPLAPHDELLDLVVTEKRVITGTRKGGCAR
ncbi:MAG: 5-formyltetrahydrofolate cyclo-ligase [Desulfobulbus propionicus]|nr:MAG: 5-formyltetrahydrofolate cyclo-ligase [Desulfobulbus propionicus]